jgi:TRAP-type mannitol/chloroaromatic compound transport system permease large subunit
VLALWMLRSYLRMNGERFEVLKLLTSSVMPLGILTAVVLAVILFGITTATESAGVGAAGAFLLAFHARTLDWKRTKEAVFLTAKTTAMVCWLFVGSALFSAVFAILGGQALLESWVLSLNMTPVQFMILSQAIIFVLGWPLEWTEIIIIFVPIFLPMLKHFGIDPILWGTLVFVNLQAAFLSPPVAMSAFYLKGVAPKHVTLNQIFAGMMPYMLIVIVCMVIMYLWPGMTLWLPKYLYGGSRAGPGRSDGHDRPPRGRPMLCERLLLSLNPPHRPRPLATTGVVHCVVTWRWNARSLGLPLESKVCTQTPLLSSNGV